MAAKLIHSLTDEHSDLQKQIGCMTGIFQLFDRQHMLTAGRRRILSGNSHLNGTSLEQESNNLHLKSASVDKYASRNMQDRQRISTESSRASISSSSWSSSFSSPECNGVMQLEQAVMFSEIPSGDSAVSLQHLSPRQSVDLWGLVKDSIYREIQGLSVKSRTEEESSVSIAKYRDSARLLSKFSNDSHGSGGSGVHQRPADVKESLRALAKLQEVSRCHNEARELTRSSSYHFKDGSAFAVVKDAPRFSYDGRDTNRMPYDSGDVCKSSLKLKDLPRLSLDSREGLMRSIAKDGAERDGNFLSRKHVSGNQARLPSVVAKLMGLEALPDFVPSSNVSSSCEKTDQSKMVQPSSLSKSSWKEPTSPRWRSPDCTMKPMSRIPIEPAPWRQIDGTKGLQKSAPKSMSRLAKAASTPFPSVYSEIEKRLKDLEFNQSGKDLGALKHILEAMQVKGLLETPNEHQDSNFSSHGDNRRQQSGQVLRYLERKAVSAQTQSHDSPIVIMKPVKLVEKSGIPTSASVVSFDGLTGLPKFQGSGRMSKGLIFKSGEQRTNGSNSVTVKSGKTVKATQQQLAKEGNAGSAKSSGSISQQIQQPKKLELEKRSRPPASPDSSRSTKQSNKQQSESSSPGGRRRVKLLHNNYQKNNDDSSEAGIQRLKNSSERSARINGIQSPSTKAAEVMLPDLKSTLVLNEEESIESGFAPAEYSSPVSVLENVLCKQDSPPGKYIGKMLNVEASTEAERNSNAIQPRSVDGFAPISADSGIAFEINIKKLKNIDNLVQKLKRLNSTHDDVQTDYIASLCENTDPDHRYISEILLASGLLLRDLTSSLMEFQFHPSGHPINPELFLVLEQTKVSVTSKAESSTHKIHRKLIFDAVNEILAGKLTSTDPLSEPWMNPSKRTRTLNLSAQKLLRFLCSKIDGLRCKNRKCCFFDEEKADDCWKSIPHEDVLCQPGGWMEHEGELSGAVLNVERMIFKDLVNEVVIGESAGLKAKPPKPK